jgi:hypothetical protein
LSRSEPLTGVETDRCGGIRIGEAHRIIERLPEDTSLQRLNKIAAGLQLLTIAVWTIEGRGSRQSGGRRERSRG